MMPGHWVEEVRGEMLLLPHPHIPWGYSLNLGGLPGGGEMGGS